MAQIHCPTCRTALEITKWEQDDNEVGCPECHATFRVGDARRARSVKVLKKRRNPANDIAAFLVSLVIPGAGHLVKSKVADGLVWFISAIACVVIALMLNQQPIIGAMGAGLVGIVSAFSAMRA